MTADVAGLQLGIEQISIGIVALAFIVAALLLFLMWRGHRLETEPRVERDHAVARGRVVLMQDVQRRAGGAK
jgi:uncharacterized iron-regulated membrane protein